MSKRIVWLFLLGWASIVGVLAQQPSSFTVSPEKQDLKDYTKLYEASYLFGQWWGKHDLEKGVPDRTAKKQILGRDVPVEQQFKQSALDECWRSTLDYLDMQTKRDGWDNIDTSVAKPYAYLALIGSIQIATSKEATFTALRQFNAGYRQSYYAKRRRLLLGVGIAMAVVSPCLIWVAFVRRRRKRNRGE
jgi:hypothetical protein